MRKKVLISCGGIPSKFDSVKYMINCFKGGLALKAAHLLAEKYDVEIVKWHGTDLTTDLPVHNIDDVITYFNFVRDFKADAYVLSGAVANLMLIDPYEGKFPSHRFKEGCLLKFDFTISPRIIDRVKEWHPRSTLIGYKLFDGTDEELMEAGREVLVGSRSNVVFANHRKSAKSEKIALMADGTHIRMGFDEHVDFISRVIDLEWYSTDQISLPPESPPSEFSVFLDKISVKSHGYSYGTVACRQGDGFVTTTRGKKGGGICYVDHVDHGGRIVYATDKATLNAPVLDILFEKFPWAQWILHGHRQLVGAPTYPYAFSGTVEESKVAREAIRMFNVANHGYYACFQSTDEARRWLNDY